MIKPVSRIPALFLAKRNPNDQRPVTENASNRKSALGVLLTHNIKGSSNEQKKNDATKLAYLLRPNEKTKIRTGTSRVR